MCGPYTSIWRRIGLALLVCTLFHVTAAGVPDLQEVLQSMGNADKKYRTHSMTIVYNEQGEVSGGDKSKVLTTVTTRQEEASGRFERKFRYYVPSPDNPEPTVLDMENQCLWTGEMAYDWGVSKRSTIKPLFISKRAETVTANKQLQGLELLSGTLSDDKPAWEVMAEQSDARVLESREVVDDVPCLVLKSSGKYGEMTLWVDDAHEHVVRKLVLVKGPNSLWHGKELSTYPNPQTEWEYRIENVQVELIDGHYVPISGVLSERRVSGLGTIISITNIEIPSIDFNPDFAAEGAFQLDVVPDGTEVWDNDVQGLKYTWNKGELVPLVDAEELDSLKQTTEQMVLAQESPQAVQTEETQIPASTNINTQTTGSRFSLRAAGLVLLAAIGCVLLCMAVRNRKRLKTDAPEARSE